LMNAGSSIAENLATVRENIERAAHSAGRDPASVKLVAVSKTVPAESVLEVLEAGHGLFGENYVQEAREKIQTVGRDRTRWHFIGHLQRNKVKYVFDLFDMVETVDSLRLAQEIDRRAQRAGQRMDILIEVNISGEETKSGIDPAAIIDLVRGISRMEGLRLKGLMTMPPFLEPEQVRPYFTALRRLRDRLRDEAIPGVELEELSMGMTSDYETAIEEGATIVRVGTGIFGPRRTSQGEICLQE